MVVLALGTAEIKRGRFDLDDQTQIEDLSLDEMEQEWQRVKATQA